MIDYARFEELHIVRKVRETVRKWWNIELSYADERGYVLDHAEGRIVPPHNGVCRGSLGTRAGFAACNSSVEAAIEEVRDAGRIEAHIVETCHLGFPIVLVPIIDSRGRFYGAIFAGGFLVDDEVERRLPTIQGKVSDARLPVDAVAEDDPIDDPNAGTWGAIPRVTRRDLSYLTDLLETTVEEILVVAKTMRDQEARIEALTGGQVGADRFGNIVGKSDALRRMFSLLDKVARSEATTLVLGENGTGKELIARAIHFNGPRKERPFVIQNCSALNDNLLESELFGHVKGSFTGATRDKRGLFKVADGGTFFLDEVGDMSPQMQVKLLRVLQEGTFMPVGGTEPEKVDVRIIAATNRDIEKMVETGEFREDLFYRLNVIRVDVPPLRDRKEDIPHLAEYFLERLAERRGEAVRRISPRVMGRLYAHDWPGNIRELENEIERLVVLAGDDAVIDEDHLAIGSTAGGPKDLERFREKGTLAAAVAALETEMIQEGLVATHWNKTQLAERLGISRTTLIKKIKDHGIDAAKNPMKGRS